MSKYPPDPPSECRYCGADVERVPDKVLYGKDYGSKLYLCMNDDCQARVGCHDESGEPLGILADAELRRWRSVAHEAFDPLWKSYDSDISRQGAYYYIEKALGVDKHRAHIGMLDLHEVKNLVWWLMKHGPSLS